MIKRLLKMVVPGIVVKLLANYRSLSLKLLKIEAAKLYLRGVQTARLSAIGLMQMGLVIALIGVGALLLHAGLFILLPWSTEAKAVLGVLLGLAYMLSGGIALRAYMDEKTWMEKSGATAMLKDAIAPSKGTNPTA